MKRTKPDRPVSFGYKNAWYAIESSDSEAVIEAIGLTWREPSNWADGVQGAYEHGYVFVAPPVNGWTLVVSPGFAPGCKEEVQLILPRLSELSARFGTTLFFATHRIVESHIWAKAVAGSIVRAYAYIGERGETYINEGRPTPEELGLGFAFFDERSEESTSADYWDREDLSFPDEESVMAISRAWSISPTDLDDLAASIEPALGTRGRSSQKLTFDRKS